METRPWEIPELTNIYLFEEFPRLPKRNFWQVYINISSVGKIVAK